MRGFLIFLLLLATSSAAQTPAAALCNGLASQIRNRHEITSGASQSGLLETLSSGTRPYIQLASPSDVKFEGDKEEAVKRFLARFNPSDALRAALNDFVQDDSVD